MNKIKNRIVSRMQKNAKKEIDLKKYETDDYQNRGGNYPKSDIPDTIRAYKNSLEFSFKNTFESDGEYWVKDFAITEELPIKNIESRQDGDYQDDWIMVTLDLDIE